MRVYELFTEFTKESEELNEGWKDTLVKGVLAGSLALGTGVNTPIKQNDFRAHISEPIDKHEKGIVSPLVGNELERNLKKEATKEGITGIELAQFMAQCFVETAGFRRLTEVGGKNYFRKYDIKYHPRKARILGNIRPGDGERYKGRGVIQLTGRYNYRLVGNALGLPLEQDPELAARPDIAAKIAVWYWKNRVKPSINDFSNTLEVTRKINAGKAALDKRETVFNRYYNTLKI